MTVAWIYYKVPRDNHKCYKRCTNKIEFDTIWHQQGNNQHTQENSCNSNHRCTTHTHKLLLMKDASNHKVNLDLFLLCWAKREMCYRNRSNWFPVMRPLTGAVLIAKVTSQLSSMCVPSLVCFSQNASYLSPDWTTEATYSPSALSQEHPPKIQSTEVKGNSMCNLFLLNFTHKTANINEC